MWKLVAGIGSIALGVLIASLLGGRPAVAGFVVLSICVVAFSAIVLSALREQLRAAQSPISPTAAETSLPADRELVTAVRGLLVARDVAWLEQFDFSMPWEGKRVQMWMELDKYLHLVEPHDYTLRRAHRELYDATRAFLELYEASTAPETMMLSRDWVEVSTADLDVGSARELEGELATRRKRLKTAALTLTDSLSTWSETAHELTGL